MMRERKAHTHDYAAHPKWASHVACVVCGFAAPRELILKTVPELLHGTPERKVRERRRQLEQLAADGERELEIPAECGGPIMLLVHRDTYPGREGKWRLTRFDAEGIPFGHTEASSFRAALEEARFWGARFEEAKEVRR